MRIRLLTSFLFLLCGTAPAQTAPSKPLPPTDAKHCAEPAHGLFGDPGEAGRVPEADPNDAQVCLMGTRVHGLARSADGGETWNRVRSFPVLPLNNIGMPFVAFDRSSGVPGQPTPVIFVGVADPVLNLLRSRDAGRTWAQVPGGPLGMFPVRGVFAPDSTLRLNYAGAQGKVNGVVWSLNPRTGAWQELVGAKAGGGAK